ncbi:SubName: Full=Uncharacterized protein {ECO:0000313/EMBL:CCA71052.1} [Serendipita indica DSM 11827]|nr:SubName: Full=Uncharacterized protein {ECO:0000313/EMBL:CCA71052.1} [Serendipita indica DSM 11827]
MKARNTYKSNYQGDAANAFGNLLKTKIKDPSVHDFITPNFSTTTPNDKIICSIIMMGTLKAYFSYGISVRCGIPSITFEGEQEDDASILQRLDKLSEFGEEPTIFTRLLRPTIDSKMTTEEREFIEKYTANPGAYDYTGPPFTMIDGLRYPVLATHKIPSGSCEVEITIHDDPVDIPCVLVAGHVAMVASATGKTLNTLRPEPQWFMFTQEKTKAEQDQMEDMFAEFDTM